MTLFLDLRVDPRGGGVAREVAIYDDQRPISPAAFAAAVGARDLIFATHGFNVDRADGNASLSYWEQWQSLPPEAVYIGVLWPGDSVYAPVIDYLFEGNEATASGDLLARFIAATVPEAASYSFVSHSLGARVVLQTIRSLGAGFRIRRLMLMASAIGSDCLTKEYADAVARVDSVSVLASHHDYVLALAYPIGNLGAHLFGSASPIWRAALGRNGPASTASGKVRPLWQIPDAWKYGHGDYLPDRPPSQAPLSLPQPVPPALTSQKPVPSPFADWQPAWTAAAHSTRYR